MAKILRSIASLEVGAQSLKASQVYPYQFSYRATWLNGFMMLTMTKQKCWITDIGIWMQLTQVAYIYIYVYILLFLASGGPSHSTNRIVEVVTPKGRPIPFLTFRQGTWTFCKEPWWELPNASWVGCGEIVCRYRYLQLRFWAGGCCSSGKVITS